MGILRLIISILWVAYALTGWGGDCSLRSQVRAICPYWRVFGAESASAMTDNRW
jgi:hypothetical protein